MNGKELKYPLLAGMAIAVLGLSFAAGYSHVKEEQGRIKYLNALMKNCDPIAYDQSHDAAYFSCSKVSPPFIRVTASYDEYSNAVMGNINHLIKN